MQPRRICILGLGYIGLPTAGLLASRGHAVHGVDVSERVVETINSGGIHIVEPDLDVVVRKAVERGHLVAALTPTEADVFIIAVPTPFRDEHAPDIRYVEAATRALAPHLAAGNLVILESTSPVGTTERVAAILEELRPGLSSGGRSYHVAHCPERVLPGRILHELVENDRIVGGVDAESTAAAGAFYRTFVKGAVLETGARTAELAKLVENSFRDVNIAFANELSMICERFGIDVWELIALANRHPRVNILTPGPGVGGHCLAVDPWFVVHGAPGVARLIRSAREINDHKADWVLEKVRAKADRFKAPRIVCLGLAYKPNVDDLRESPALYIARQLTATYGEGVRAVEPHLAADAEVDGVHLDALDAALQGADLIVGLVGHRAFAGIDREILRSTVLIDTVGMFR